MLKCPPAIASTAQPTWPVAGTQQRPGGFPERTRPPTAWRSGAAQCTTTRRRSRSLPTRALCVFSVHMPRRSSLSSSCVLWSEWHNTISSSSDSLLLHSLVPSVAPRGIQLKTSKNVSVSESMEQVDFELQPNESAWIECSATARPPARVRWSLDEALGDAAAYTLRRVSVSYSITGPVSAKRRLVSCVRPPTASTAATGQRTARSSSKSSTSWHRTLRLLLESNRRGTRAARREHAVPRDVPRRRGLPVRCLQLVSNGSQLNGFVRVPEGCGAQVPTCYRFNGTVRRDRRPERNSDLVASRSECVRRRHGALVPRSAQLLDGEAALFDRKRSACSPYAPVSNNPYSC